VVVQGVSDMLMGAAAALGGAFSGLILSWAGYPGLNLAGGVVAVAVLTAAVMALVPGRGRPSRLGKLPGRAGRSVAD
jgi:hypothetical protein